jgi:hypothetical protein
MLWLYLLATLLIAWGLVKDLSRGETWLLGFGRITLKGEPRRYWLTVVLRIFILVAVVAAAWARSQMP